MPLSRPHTTTAPARNTILKRSKPDNHPNDSHQPSHGPKSAKVEVHQSRYANGTVPQE